MHQGGYVDESLEVAIDQVDDGSEPLASQEEKFNLNTTLKGNFSAKGSFWV